MAYLAVHNHGSDDHVGFSPIDLESHVRGYPALRDIANGMPVGALVLGKNSMQADVWMPHGERLTLSEATVVGPTVRRLYPRAPIEMELVGHVSHDRQLRMVGAAGQRILGQSTVGIIGLGGVGSLVNEYLSRLGVGHLILVDFDLIEQTNLSRVVGATQADVDARRSKVEIAERVATLAAPAPRVTTVLGDYANDEVARKLRTCDFLFLAADSMRARLVFNATVHQYLVPGVQLGAKITNQNGAMQAWSVARAVRPGQGCLLCNGFIDPTELAIESKSDDERKAQAYGVREPNPSVITLNAVAAAHG
ncbi:MAG TPA: ThiF family adenylyltransferase, partial [Ramlibacter sp.]|nr:ThiF family adenylyltransferase [Ramlibacter sp.]